MSSPQRLSQEDYESLLYSINEQVRDDSRNNKTSTEFQLEPKHLHEDVLGTLPNHFEHYESCYIDEKYVLHLKHPTE